VGGSELERVVYTPVEMIAPIQLTDAAKFYKEQEQQVAAFQWLQEQQKPGVMAVFAKMYRDTPEPPPKPEAQPGYITSDLMMAITGHPASSFDAAFCNDFNDMLESTGFDQHLDAMQMLMANLCHESAGFVYMKEIDSGEYLNGRKDLGNIYPGDGPKFRGCGPLQVTGRNNHQASADWLRDHRGIDDGKIMDIGTDYSADHYAFSIAIPWLLNNDLLAVCLHQGFEACCVRINGGYNGYDDRCAWYSKCKLVMT
jgi:putative chitinase